MAPRLILILAGLLATPMSLAATGTFSADGNSTVISCQSGTGRVALEGGGGNNFGSGTATLQFYINDGYQAGSSSSNWTADSGAVPFDVGAPAQLRINLAGSTSPDLDWQLVCDREQ